MENCGPTIGEMLAIAGLWAGGILAALSTLAVLGILIYYAVTRKISLSPRIEKREKGSGVDWVKMVLYAVVIGTVATLAFVLLGR